MRPVLLCALLVAVTAPADAADYLAEIRSACAQKWGTDYEMVEYCQNNQREALMEVGRLVRGQASSGPHQGILEHCLGKWSRGEGFDWEMVSYCYNNQAEAYDRLQRQ